MTATIILSVILISAGGYLSVLSWGVLVRWLRHDKSTSWFPFLGGGLLAGGVALLPWDCLSRLWWLAFLLDYGSIPGAILALAVHLRRLAGTMRRAGGAERHRRQRDPRD